jgi:hypothetical protein
LESSILDRSEVGGIPYVLYEVEIIDGIKRAIKILQKVDIGAPVLICISLLNVRGLRMSDGNHERDTDNEHTILQKDLILPGMLYDDYEQDVAKILQPAFDLVWNACGIPKSRNYDASGNFIARRR